MPPVRVVSATRTRARTRTRRRSGGSLASLALAACATLAGLAWSGPALAWWNCAWAYRAPLDVSASTTSSNALVEAVLPGSTLPAYAWNGTDADVRVVDADDATLLPHYTEPRPGNAERLRIWFRVPSLGPTPRRVYLYYGNAAATSTASGTLFTERGVRLLTRQRTGPRHFSFAEFAAQFDAAASPAGYGCRVLPDFEERSNAEEFGAAQDVHYSVLFQFEVPGGQAGDWRLRLGPDYGYGGALYLNGRATAERWGVDLWWNRTYGRPDQLLEAGATLPAGRHFVATYGTEDCCEGPQTLQMRRGTGPWREVARTNFQLWAPSCPLPGLTVRRVADPAAQLVVRQLSTTVEDPVGGTAQPKAIPGARTRYAVRVTQPGGGRILDPDSLRVVVPVPANTSLFLGDLGGTGSGPVRFLDGSPGSGFSFTYGGLANTTDDVEFSRDGGASFGYVPQPDALGTDALVTHVRVNPKGRPVCGAAPGPRSFDLELDVVVR